MKMERKSYIKPIIQFWQFDAPNSLLERFSGRGSVSDYEDGGDEWLLDGDGEPFDWFED